MSRRHAGYGVAVFVCVAALHHAARADAAGGGETTVPDTSIAAPTSSTAAPSWEPHEIAWREIMPGLEDGYLEVPIDYTDPQAGMLRIHIVRHLADDPNSRVGSLLFNPGGPGFGGSEFVSIADQVFSAELLDAFDIVGFDPRGTGLSEPAIDCIDDYDHFYSGTDITPDDDAERQQIVALATEFAEACEGNNADIIQFVGTNNAARDMDSIRRALGEDEISYYGTGYGSALGGVWATMFPSTVRAAVFDSAPDPHATTLEASLRQVGSFERALSTYLAQCSADATCAFHNDGAAEEAFDELMLDLDANPIPSIEGRPEITRGVALTAVAHALYSDTLWPELSAALSSAQAGAGAALLGLYDDYFGYEGAGTWGNELEAFQTIACMDVEERLSVDEDDATAQAFNDVAPRMSPQTTGGYFCTFFPASTDPRLEITGAGAGPIVLCGATGDASSPVEDTRAMAASLEDGHLIVIDGVSSGCFGVSECADQLIADYLVDLDTPAEETSCETNS